MKIGLRDGSRRRRRHRSSFFRGQGLGLEEFRSMGATEVVFTKFKRLLGSIFSNNAIGVQ